MFIQKPFQLTHFSEMFSVIWGSSFEPSFCLFVSIIAIRDVQFYSPRKSKRQLENVMLQYFLNIAFHLNNFKILLFAVSNFFLSFQLNLFCRSDIKYTQILFKKIIMFKKFHSPTFFWYLIPDMFAGPNCNWEESVPCPEI